jgi:aromatic-L-amino-acid decarboxylase
MRVERRHVPVEMSQDEFRQVGHELVDRIADFLATLPERPVNPGKSPEMIRHHLGDAPLPQQGAPACELLNETAELLFNNSTFNGHPRFWGYITASATPIGALGDLLAAAVNPNLGGWQLSPIATEIEAQTVRWIAELIGYPSGSGGLLTSGGNMANFTGFLAARQARADWDVRGGGLLDEGGRQLTVYVSRETHTWIEKAADLFGFGTNNIRWIATDQKQQMNPDALRQRIEADLVEGYLPFLVVGTAGSTSTGAIDPLPDIAGICQEHDLWFHVDGAYGALAAALPNAPADIRGIRLADSVALDPHKWLYSPLEAGCTLVRHPNALVKAFSYSPDYYHFDAETIGKTIDYYEYGLQNSRGFRALKVWLALRQAGREGYVQMIKDDMELAKALYELASTHPELQAFTQNLSITTFRYVPADLDVGTGPVESYLNELNSKLLDRLQAGGEAYLSNAIVNGRFLLRLCVVNFRTTLADIEALPEIVVRIGREVDLEMRSKYLQMS